MPSVCRIRLHDFREGRRFPVSINDNMPTETWACSATCSRVQPRAVRRRRSSSARVAGASDALITSSQARKTPLPQPRAPVQQQAWATRDPPGPPAGADRWRWWPGWSGRAPPAPFPAAPPLDQSPGVAVPQRVQRSLQGDPSQLGRLAQLLADVLAVHRLVPPTTREDRLLRPPLQAGRLGVDQNRQPDRRRQRPLALLAAFAGVAVDAALQVQVAPAQVAHL